MYFRDFYQRSTSTSLFGRTSYKDPIAPDHLLLLYSHLSREILERRTIDHPLDFDELNQSYCLAS